MELWFWAAVCATFLSGFSNYFFKVAARHGYDSELFNLYGGLFSILFLFPIAWIFSTFSGVPPAALWISFVAGTVAAIGGVGKVYALRYIDTTIYFPLFKLLSPIFAIVLGIVFFSEIYSTHEWIGLLIGVTVPLLLITRSENARQNNLYLGLLLVLVTGVISAGAAAANKLSIDIAPAVLPVLAVAALGVFTGSLSIIALRKGVSKVYAHARDCTSKALLVIAGIRSVFVSVSLGLVLWSYALGGGLAVVHTILSLYILIPIVLSIVFYKEHWNLQKAMAIVLSVAALALLG